MTAEGVFLALLTGGVAFVWWGLNHDGEIGAIGNLVLGLITITCGALAYNNLGEEAVAHKQAIKQAQAEARRKDRIPRFYSDAPDGCKIFTFKPENRWLYFTRCPGAKTSTETTWTESCGKNCTRTASQTIETQ
ncbi:MAG: hypothetical protein LCH90_19275 [Proteobacteria bacterium]|nr:hypothetical protein [Pseudomonadota bacterium]